MFFSKVLLFTISLGAISVLATPHALYHNTLHHRAIAARVASNATDVTVKRQNSPKCKPPVASSASSSASSSSIPSPSIPSVKDIVNTTPLPPATTPPPAPTPTPSSTSTPQQPPTTTSTAGTSAPGTGGGPFTGQGTWFATGLGACGTTNTASQFIVAVSEIRFDSFPGAVASNPNLNPICGKQVVITAGGATATATVTDRCTGCKVNDLDMTTGLFQVFADLGVGRMPITWNFA